MSTVSFLRAASLLVVMIASACESPAREPRADTVEASRLMDVSVQDVIVKDRGVDPGCTVDGVLGDVHDFVDAIDEKDTDRVRGRLSEDFRWFSVKEPGKANLSLFQVDDMLDYVRRSREENLEMELIALRVDGSEEPRQANVVYGVAVTADHLDDEVNVGFGKGAVDCDEGAVILWSMGVETRPEGVGYVAGDFNLSRNQVNAALDRTVVAR